ncbi:MAG: hypothetical protein AMXMBFR34_07650 [Myxococcaceae bacterium]
MADLRAGPPPHPRVTGDPRVSSSPVRTTAPTQQKTPAKPTKDAPKESSLKIASATIGDGPAAFA